MHVLLTIDTELSPRLQRMNVSLQENLERSIFGRVANGEWGLSYQLKQFDRAGLRAVFFVEALSAHVFGFDALKRVVEPILAHGHEVQLHLHSEWLPWFEADPVGGRRGDNLAEFSRSDQTILLELGLDALHRCGVPAPVAFRAGNYGANNDTLAALASLGLTYDSSYNYPYMGGPCGISVAQPLLDPTVVEGVVEVPIGFFSDFPGHYRHAQLCAISFNELAWLVTRYAAQKRQALTIVSHSFELLDRNRQCANRLLVRRFERLCDFLGANTTTLATCGFADLPAAALGQPPGRHEVPRSNPMRSVMRLAEQAYGTLLYDRQ